MHVSCSGLLTMRKQGKTNEGTIANSFDVRTVLPAAVLAILAIGLAVRTPFYASEASVQTDFSTAHPYDLHQENGKQDVRFGIHLSDASSTLFEIHPFGTIERLVINDKDVNVSSVCKGSTLALLCDLKASFQKGKNTVRLLVSPEDHDSQTYRSEFRMFSFKPSRFDAPFLLMLLFALLSTYACFRPLLKRTIFMKSFGMEALFLAGVLMRFAYVIWTPFDVRSPDAFEHLEYIDYVATYFVFPAAADGWEFHQSPLYYYLTGALTSLLRGSGYPNFFILGTLQSLSLLFSAAMLAVCFAIAHEAFKAKDVALRTAFVLSVTFFPALTYFSSQVSNNGLFHLCLSIWMLLLIRWQKSASPSTWNKASAMAAICILTRANGVLTVPVMLGALLMKRGFSKHLARPVCTLALIVLTGAGWYAALRMNEEDVSNSFTFSNQHFRQEFSVSNDLISYVTFNPMRVLRDPSVYPPFRKEGRNNFWEYFFQTALVGESSLEPKAAAAASWLMLTGMLCAMLSIIGLSYRLLFLRRTHDADALMLMTFATFLCAAVLYRYATQIVSNQNFRLSAFLVIPSAYFLAGAIPLFPPAMRRILQKLPVVFCGLCVAFLLLQMNAA